MQDIKDKYLSSSVEVPPELTKVESIGKYTVYLNKTTFVPYVDMDGKLEEVSAPLVAQLKKSMETVQKLKVDVQYQRSNLSFGNRVLKYGPTGTGKTYEFLEACNTLIQDGKLLPENMEVVTISDGFEDTDLLAHMVFVDGKPTFMDNRIVELFYKAAELHKFDENGKLVSIEDGQKIAICLDELNRGSRSLLNLVLKMLDAVDGEYYTLQNHIKGISVRVPIKNVLFFATMNLGSKYVGTSTLDEALLDRFNIVEFKGYSEDVEKEIAKKAFGKYSKEVLKFLSEVRELAKDGEIRSPISTRGLKMWGESFINSGIEQGLKELLSSFNSTLLYRLVGVDDIGSPDESQKAAVLALMETSFKFKIEKDGSIKDLSKPEAETPATPADESPITTTSEQPF
jgi:hypothetical protein